MQPRLRVTVRALSCCLLLGLTACASVGDYSALAPVDGWNITGIWVLNTALSTDTRKALAGIVPKPAHPHRPGATADDGGSTEPDGGTGPDTDSGSAGTPPGAPAGGDGDGDGDRGGGVAGAPVGLPRRATAWRPPIDLQTQALAGGQWLQISRHDADLVIANAVGSNSYTPGEKSVVSVLTGVADQSTGWKGHDFVLDIRPQVGPHMLERYGLSPDGRRLTVHIDIDSEGPNRALKVLRVYDRANAIPQELPGR